MALVPYQEDDDVCTVINDCAHGRFSSRDSLMNAVMKQRQMLFDALEGSLDRGTIERGFQVLDVARQYTDESVAQAANQLIALAASTQNDQLTHFSDMLIATMNDTQHKMYDALYGTMQHEISQGIEHVFERVKASQLELQEHMAQRTAIQLRSFKHMSTQRIHVCACTSTPKRRAKQLAPKLAQCL